MTRPLRPRWFSRARLRDAGHPRLLGVLELPPRGGISLELHLVRLTTDGASIGAWFDESGRRWSFVEAGRA